MIDVSSLVPVATGREGSLCSADLEARDKELRSTFTGTRVLVTGGAGSIGSATVKLLLTYEPTALHVVDQNENSLAELIRDLRASGLSRQTGELRTLPIDLGSATMARFIAAGPPYDVTLNFAALKHVRSEKDAFSLVQMLDTNVLKAASVMRELSRHSPGGVYFAVSTDKAASPTSLMGASKRLMEHLILGRPEDFSGMARLASARFANVAFSAGSLLESVLHRVQKRQLVAVPGEVRRYFISPEEAGGMCALAAACAPDQHLLIPKLSAAGDLQDLQDVVSSVLTAMGLTPHVYHEEAAARGGLEKDIGSGAYPMLVTKPDTDGEKAFEEFLGPGESALEIGLESALAVKHLPGPPGSLAIFMSRLEEVVRSPQKPVAKADLVRWVQEAVPELEHVETGRSLDDQV